MMMKRLSLVFLILIVSLVHAQGKDERFQVVAEGQLSVTTAKYGLCQYSRAIIAYVDNKEYKGWFFGFQGNSKVQVSLYELRGTCIECFIEDEDGFSFYDNENKKCLSLKFKINGKGELEKKVYQEFLQAIKTYGGEKIKV